MLNNKRILVTGGAGFIGSNLCEFLVNKGAFVICLDNFSTGFRKNISKLMANNKFELIEGDIRDLDTCQNACHNIDFVLHQAALGSVPRSINNPSATNDVNINGFLNMLIASRDNQVKRFIYAASSSTYGDSIELPKVEERIGKPLSPYAVTKYVNELYADVFAKTYSMETIGLRYFNVYGRRQSPEGAYAAVIPIFINKLMNYESPIINGDGTFSRDFTYIDNVLHMNFLALTTSNEKAINNIYNTAVGDRVSLNELAFHLRNLLSELDPAVKDVEIKYGPSRAGDIPHSHASVQKAKSLLGYEPKYKFKDGISQTVEWYWDNYKLVH